MARSARVDAPRTEVDDHLARHGSTASRYRRPALRLIAGAVGVYVFLAVVGLLLTRVLQQSAIVRSDHRVSEWFYARRTPTLDTLTHWGTSISNTQTAIVATAIIAVGLRLWLHRWRESATIVVCIVGELTIFLGVTSTVHRTRPTVPHLDPAPPTSSFPSGHVGAAVALYVGLAVLILWRSRRRAPATLFALVLCCLPIIVALSRLYRGMHYLTDVCFGAVAGGAWMILVVTTLGRRHDRADRPRAESA